MHRWFPQSAVIVVAPNTGLPPTPSFWFPHAPSRSLRPRRYTSQPHHRKQLHRLRDEAALRRRRRTRVVASRSIPQHNCASRLGRDWTCCGQRLQGDSNQRGRTPKWQNSSAAHGVCTCVESRSERLTQCHQKELVGSAQYFFRPDIRACTRENRPVLIVVCNVLIYPQEGVLEITKDMSDFFKWKSTTLVDQQKLDVLVRVCERVPLMVSTRARKTRTSVVSLSRSFMSERTHRRSSSAHGHAPAPAGDTSCTWTTGPVGFRKNQGDGAFGR